VVDVDLWSGNVSWVVQRLTDGSLSWALRGYEDGEQVVKRGISADDAAAKRDMALALVELVMQPQSSTTEAEAT
jgi:hypothetical protein